MTQEQAIQTLVQAVLVGQAKGAYTLDEAVIVKEAIDAFKQTTAQPEASEPQSEK